MSLKCQNVVIIFPFLARPVGEGQAWAEHAGLEGRGNENKNTGR